MDIQTRTALAALLLIDIALLAAFASAYRSHSRRFGCTRCWRDFAAAVLVCHAAIVLRGPLPETVSIVLANLALSIAGLALYAGCAGLAGRPAPGRRGAAAVAGLQLIYLYFTFVRPDITVRSTLSSLILAASAAGGTVQLARPADPANRPLFAAGVAAMALTAAVHLARTVCLAVPAMREWDFAFILLIIGLEALLGFAYLRMIDGLLRRQLLEAAEEKTLLLHELRHRTKNNLSLIGSLISLQAGQIADPVSKAAFDDLENRIRTIASVFRLLSSEDDKPGASARDYLGSVVAGLRDGLAGSRHCAFALDAADVPLEASALVPLGLIANELGTNAIKHAFPDERADALISFEFRAEAGGYRLTVADNGVGLSGAEPDGLGLTLARSLARQLRGRLDTANCPAGGTAITVAFPEARDRAAWAGAGI